MFLGVGSTAKNAGGDGEAGGAEEGQVGIDHDVFINNVFGPRGLSKL